jgi:predicted Holliday junction resolvase-like endonuclease
LDWRLASSCKPLDILIFKGMDDQRIDEVVFVEIKTGNSQLSSNEPASATSTLSALSGSQEGRGDLF